MKAPVYSMRIFPNDEATIRRGASLDGLRFSTFIVRAAVRSARAVIREHDRLMDEPVPTGVVLSNPPEDEGPQ